ncbi:MAG: hypothetical protein V4502_10645 [Pseudomonadota bacterium]
MSARSFRSLFMVASCAGAALGCYLVSLRVASERASLEQVETRIVLAQRDLRVLQTEIGTRGRLSQLERWNAGAFALSAPAADQFLQGSFELARLAQPDRHVDFHAPVVLASAPQPDRAQAPVGQPASDESGQPAATRPNALLHEASLKTETREVPARTVAELPLAAVPKSTDKPATAARPAASKSVDKPGLAAAQSMPRKPAAKPALTAARPAAKKSVDKPALAAARPVTKPVRLAKLDPLAPLPAKHSTKSRDSTADR